MLDMFVKQQQRQKQKTKKNEISKKKIIFKCNSIGHSICSFFSELEVQKFHKTWATILCRIVFHRKKCRCYLWHYFYLRRLTFFLYYTLHRDQIDLKYEEYICIPKLYWFMSESVILVYRRRGIC